MILRIGILAIFVWFGFLGLNAQSVGFGSDENRTGSVYSYIGLGTPIDLRSANTAGMGLSGVAMYNGIVANTANPAIWSRALFTQGMGTFRVARTISEDSQQGVVNALIDAINFQLVLPIEKDKFAAAVSLMPLTRKNYAFFNRNALSAQEIGTASDVAYINDNKGEGGLNRFEIGFGYSVNQFISIGYAPSVTFGYFENSVSTTFANPIYRPLTYVFKERFHGITHRLGFYAFKNRPFAKRDLLSFGLNLELGADLTAKEEITATYTVIDGQDFQGNDRIESRETNLNVAGRTGSGTGRLPMKLEAGVLYQTTPALAFSSEYLYQNWSNFENRLGNTLQNLQDRSRYALGIQWTPVAVRRNQNNLFTTMQYRGGISVDSGYLNYNGTEINALSGHIGLSIPAKNSRSSVDIAFEYGVRGTTDQNLVRERFWAIRMSFNLAELMFFERRFQ